MRSFYNHEGPHHIGYKMVFLYGKNMGYKKADPSKSTQPDANSFMNEMYEFFEDNFDIWLMYEYEEVEDMFQKSFVTGFDHGVDKKIEESA